MCLVERGELEKEWMMFTFRAGRISRGTSVALPRGGAFLAPPSQPTKWAASPTSEMDRKIFTYLLEGEKLSIGQLEYSREEELLSHHLH